MTRPPVPHAEMLLANAGFVRCVARAALHGDRDVDDVVQETWLAALQSAPRRPGALKEWLAGIARRQAANRIRREISTRRREAAAARPDVSRSAAELAAQVELGRRLVDAVLALEEPYRQALLLRYYQDLPPREIAARLGLPVETVRTHVKRGLERLRGRLDGVYRDHPGGPAAAMLAILAPIPAHVLPSLAGTIGGVLMAHRVLVAATLVLLVVGASVWVATDLSDTPRSEGPPGVPLLGRGVEPPAVAGPVLQGEGPREAPRAAERAGPSPGTLHGLVVEKGTGAPVVGVPVYATHLVERGVEVATRSDREGRFTFAGLPPGEASVFALGAGWVSDGCLEVSDGGYDPTVRRLPIPDGRTLTLEVVRCAVVEGVVLDAGGAPVAGAAVEATPAGFDRRPRRPHDPRVVTTAEDGTFRHDALVPHRACGFTAHSPGHPSASVPGGTLRPGEDNPPLTIRLPAGRRLQVSVLDAATGAGVAGAEVYASWIDAATGHLLQTEWRTDEDGRADVGVVPCGRVRLDHRAAGYREPSEATWVPEAGPGAEREEVRLRLDPGLSVLGRVVVPLDVPPVGLTVHAEALTAGNASSAEFPVASDGTFEITGLAPGAYRVQATLEVPPRWLVGATRAEAPSRGAVIELRPSDGPFYEEPGPDDRRLVEVSLVVVSPAGTPLEQGWVRFFDDVAASAVDLAAGPARIRVDGGGSGVWFEVCDLGVDEKGAPLAAGVYGPLVPVGDVLTLRVEAGAALRGRVVTESGAGIAGAGVAAFLPDRGAPASDPDTDPVVEGHTDGDGDFLLEGLRTGPYLLRVSVPPGFAPPGQVTARAGDAAITVRLHRAQAVPVRVLDVRGNPVAGARVAVHAAGRPHPAFWDLGIAASTDTTGLARLEGVALRETYALTVLPPQDRETELLVHVEDAWLAGPTDLRLVPGVATEGVVRDAEGRPVADAIVWWWEEDDTAPGSTAADAEGRFRIGPTRAGTLLLQATLPTDPRSGPAAPRFADCESVPAGARDVTVVVRR